MPKKKKVKHCPKTTNERNLAMNETIVNVASTEAQEAKRMDLSVEEYRLFVKWNNEIYPKKLEQNIVEMFKKDNRSKTKKILVIIGNGLLDVGLTTVKAGVGLYLFKLAFDAVGLNETSNARPSNLRSIK